MFLTSFVGLFPLEVLGALSEFVPELKFPFLGTPFFGENFPASVTRRRSCTSCSVIPLPSPCGPPMLASTPPSPWTSDHLGLFFLFPACVSSSSHYLWLVPSLADSPSSDLVTPSWLHFRRTFSQLGAPALFELISPLLFFFFFPDNVLSLSWTTSVLLFFICSWQLTLNRLDFHAFSPCRLDKPIFCPSFYLEGWSKLPLIFRFV